MAMIIMWKIPFHYVYASSARRVYAALRSEGREVVCACCVRPTAHSLAPYRLSLRQRVTQCTMGKSAPSPLGAADYFSWIKTPQQLAESKAEFVMNRMTKNHGHVTFAKNFTAMLGFPDLTKTGLAAAQRLQQAGQPFAYLTLTNDHQPLTENGHDSTLEWERGASSATADVVLIGPPGKHVLEGPRKAIFCQMSEGLANLTGDPWQRFAPPCVTKDPSRSGSSAGTEYRALIESAPSVLKSATYAQSAKPRWLTRKVATKKVAAAGQFMYPMNHEAALKANVAASLHNHELLLLRYVDPPLLQHGTHLGAPVQTRVEVRIFGLVQWEPLRIWTSRYGFFRGGTPWFNYSASVDFDARNGAMWNINRGVEAKCESTPPKTPPAWRDAVSYESARTCGAGVQQHVIRDPKCCICLTVADVFDIDHDERGFATSGTLRRLDHVVERAGLQPKRVWQSVDEALIREFIVEQRRFQREANGAPLSRWSTLFSADVGFAADGRAYLYENLLMPNWKRAGYFWHEAVDRAGAIGIYSGMTLAMAPLLVDRAADDFHHGVINASLGEHAQQMGSRPNERDLLTFLRTQGFASVLGFRRTWPTPARAKPHAMEWLADERDRTFAKQLNDLNLLLPGLDVLSANPPAVDAWGGVAAKPSERSTPRWPVGNGRLFGAPNGPGRGQRCSDSDAIVAAYDAQAKMA